MPSCSAVNPLLQCSTVHPLLSTTQLIYSTTQLTMISKCSKAICHFDIFEYLKYLIQSLKLYTLLATFT